MKDGARLVVSGGDVMEKQNQKHKHNSRLPGFIRATWKLNRNETEKKKGQSKEIQLT